jgi:probable phosphoglycerate mutase
MTADTSGSKPASHPITTSVLVVRHAESEANAGGYFASQSDSPLSEKGQRQALSLATFLSATAIDVVYSSDLSRAKATAAPVAAALGQEVHVTEVLRERHMGVFTGMSFEDAKRKYPDIWHRLVVRDPLVAPPGGETHVDLAARVSGFLSSLLSKHRGRVLLLVSHGVTIHHTIRQLMGIHDLSIPLWLAVDNASVSRIDVVEPAEGVTVPRLAYVNRVPPMEGRVIPM